MLQTNVPIIPVFYRVQPYDLRHVQIGIYADAFARHRRKGRYNFKKIEEWKEALRNASDLPGAILDTDMRDEGKLLREIVDSTLHKLKREPLEVARFPVGLDEAVQDFESKFGSSTDSENVQIVGIVGMGGMGKTTLAKELYNRKCSSISRSSFLSNVRDAASTNTLHNLQQNLLNDLRIQHPTFHNIHQGMGIFCKGLRSMTVLIVFDDMDHVDQMDALLSEEAMDNLGQGSFIIVTTRKVDVLTSRGISSIYHMKLLDIHNAKQLFCRHAFLQPRSKPESEQLLHSYPNFLIEGFVKACNGLPLSLKVLGAMVKGQSEAYWLDQLLKVSRILPEDIAKRLKLSYDALDREEQQMFLDVACFFIGEKKSLVVEIWDGSGWSGKLGLQALVDKCLVGLGEDDRIEMHDHLRDLGREIAENVSPSRIWDVEQIRNQEGRTQIRGIVLDGIRDYSSTLEQCMQRIRPSLRALQLLAVRGNAFREEFVASSRDLLWLRLFDFNGTNFPSWFSLANLRVLELRDAENLEELWHDNMEPPLQLRELIIDMVEENCFRGLPRSIGRLRHLKKIVLSGNDSGMRSLPEEFCDLQSLAILQLSYFPQLSSLPDDFGKLRNLQSLKLYAVQLMALPLSFRQLRASQPLDISHSDSLMFISEELMTQLQVLRIEDCPQLVELPHLTAQVSLRKLVLSNTGLRELPNNIGHLTKLETLVIKNDWLTTGTTLTIMPESLGALSCFTSLVIRGCEMSECLSEAFRRLSNLQYFKISNTRVVELGLRRGSPSGCNLKSLKILKLSFTEVCRISICDYCCPSLEELFLWYNYNLTDIDTLPKSVRKIKVFKCGRLKNMRAIGGLLKLRSLVVDHCPNLEVLPCPTYLHSIAHAVRIRDCPKINMDEGNDDEKDDEDMDGWMAGSDEE